MAFDRYGPVAVLPGLSGSSRVLIENGYVVAVAVLAFLIVLWLSGGSLYAAFGALASISGIGWAVRRVLRPRQSSDL